MIDFQIKTNIKVYLTESNKSLENTDLKAFIEDLVLQLLDKHQIKESDLWYLKILANSYLEHLELTNQVY